MALDIREGQTNLLVVTIEGILKKVEFDHAQTVAARLIERTGKIRLLIFLKNFQGWERGQDWGDVSFQMAHEKDIEKIAIVGDPHWRDLAFAFTAQPFRPEVVQYFDPSQLEHMQAWLGEDRLQ